MSSTQAFNKLKIPVLLFIALFTGHELPAQASDFLHCYDYGCKSTLPISFSDRQWQRISFIFTPQAANAAAEKQQIRLAIALMETFAGQLSGTYRDRGGNYNGEDLTHQQDCIDESTNTMQYLYALQQRRLLRWHSVEGKKQRITWLIFPHWTAVIRDKESKRLYAVDSWYRDNGQPPYIQPLEDWMRKASFPVELNPDRG